MLLRFDYTAREAEVTHRRVEPLRLVSLGRRWYLVAWDRDGMDWRSFRLDRVSGPEPTGERFRARELPAEALAAQVGRRGTVTPDGEGCVLEMNVDDLGWPVMVLAGSGAAFVVESPPELVDRVAEVGARFSRTGAA